MNLFKCTILSLLRQPVKTLILLLVFFGALVGELSSLVLLYSADASQDTLLEKIGATVTLNESDEVLEANDTILPVFTQEVIDKVLTVEHVVGCNQECSAYVIPKNFTNCKYYTGINPASQKVQFVNEGAEELYTQYYSNFVVLKGNSGLEWIDVFRTEKAVLKEGSFPSAEHPGVIISEQLAEVNGLSVGDTLTVTDYECETGNTASVEVVGIYSWDASVYFSVTTDNLIGVGAFCWSPYNKLYADLETATSLFEQDPETLYIDFYIDSPENVQAAGEAIKALDIDWDTYSLINTTQTEYNAAASQIISTISVCRLMIAFISFISVVALLLVTSIWAERSQYECGIYLALGASRWRSLLQQLCSTLVTLLPAVVLALCLSRPLAETLLQLIGTLSVTGETHSSFTSGLESAAITVLNPTAEHYLLFALCAVLVVAFSCLLPAYCVARLKPREILAKQS